MFRWVVSLNSYNKKNILFKTFSPEFSVKQYTERHEPDFNTFMHNAVKWPQGFKSMFGHFTTLCMKGLMSSTIASTFIKVVNSFLTSTNMLHSTRMCSVRSFIVINFAKVVLELVKDISEMFINSICHNSILLLQLLSKQLPLQRLTVLVFLQPLSLHLLLPIITITKILMIIINNSDSKVYMMI